MLLIGGFLGSGKTTLVNHLLRTADDRRVAVLVNDFGDISIDAQLIESAEGDVLHIAGGCMCCTYGDDLVAALKKLSLRRQFFDHVVIETSGVSLPYPIACTISLIDGFRFQATIVMVDAVSFFNYVDDALLSDTMFRQLASADLVIFNKTDLITQSQCADYLTELAKFFPATKIHTAVQAGVTPQIFWGAASDKRPNSSSFETSSSSRGLFAAGPRLGHGIERGPTDIFVSRTLEFPNYCDFAFLGKTLDDYRSSVLRAKVIGRDLDGIWKYMSFSTGRHDLSNLRNPLKRGYGVFILRKTPDVECLFRDLSTYFVPMPNKPEIFTDSSV